MKKRFTLILATAFLYMGNAMAQWDFTFNRTSDTAAEVTVANGGEAVENVTATIAISSKSSTNYLTTKRLQGTNSAENSDSHPTDFYENGVGILCINHNTNAATKEAPNKYTLTVTNNSDKDFEFDYIEVSGVAVNSSGSWQGKNTARERNFEITFGETTLAAKQLYINNSVCYGGKETVHGFGGKVVIPANGTYTIAVAIYNYYENWTSDSDSATPDHAKGCFYGLTKISLGKTTVTTGKAGYATLYAPIALTVPAGATVYTGTLDDTNTYLTLNAIEAGSTIPEKTAVIVEGTPDETYAFAEATETAESVAGNDLKGNTSTVAASTVGGTVYTLQSHEDGVAFKKYTGEKLFGGKSYLVLPAESNALAISFTRGSEEGSTGMDVQSVRPADPTAIYDLTGRRISSMEKGIYIVNGKKIVVK